MTASTTMDEMAILDELTYFLRNQDILSTTVRGVTRVTEEFDGTGAQTDFVLANVPHNVKTVTVTGVAKLYGFDWTVNYATKTVTFLVAPGAGTNNVDITYDHGTGDKIYPDWPRDYLTLAAYPRIGIEVTSVATEEFGIGAYEHMNDILISIYVGVPANIDSAESGIGGTRDLQDIHTAIRDAIRQNSTSFYTFPYIRPTDKGPVGPGKNNKILEKSSDFQIRFKLG